uniref:RNA-directed DNA polymerase n=1 Tax=Tetranychus urticae TaxID=32264 RepID=T1KG82_TETUR
MNPNSTFQLATSAGLPMNSVPDIDYCYVLTESGIIPPPPPPPPARLKNLSIDTMKYQLKNWKIKFITNDEVIKRKFYDAVLTLFTLNNVPEATQEMMEQTEENHLYSVDQFPAWITELREEGVSEADIREIILKIGSEPKVMVMASDNYIKKMSIKTPAKRLIGSILSRWSAQRPNVKSVVKPNKRVSEIINESSKSRDTVFDEEPKAGTSRRNEDEEEEEEEDADDRDQSRDRHRDQSRDRDYDSDTRVFDDDEPRRISYGRVKPKLPKLPQYVTGTVDPWQWLQTIKRILSLERCHDDDKLYVLQKAMAYEFLPYAKKLDKQKHTSKSYIKALETKLRNPAVISQATAEFHQLKWNYDMHPEEFIRKLETMVIKVKGEPSPAEFIQDVLIRLPMEVKDTLIRTKSVHDIQELTASLVNEYNIELRKRGEKKESFRGDRRDTDKRDASRNTNSASFRSAGKPAFRCYNCGNLGHSSRECRQPRKSRTYENPTNATKQEGRNEGRFQPANLRMANVNQPSYGQNQQQQTSQAAKESTNFTSERKINGKLARAPSADYSFMMNEENGQRPVELITKIDESIKNFPTVRLTICQPDRTVIKTGDVLLDTGACTSCIDYTLSQRMKAYILTSNMAVRGIIADSIQAVEGAAYAILKHPKMKKSRIIKFQVMRNLEPMMLLGNRFADVFFAGMVNVGGRYQVNLREEVDSEWLNAELMFRFCTPEESIGLIDKPEVPTVNTVNDNSIERLPYSPWLVEEKPISQIIEMDEMDGANEESFADILSSREVDNIVPVFFQKVENNDLNLAERLWNRMDSNLNVDKRNELLSILMQFEQVFSKTKSDLGFVPWERWPITIDIGEANLGFQKPYPCTIEKRLEYRKIINELKANDIIEDSTSEGGSPAMLIGKPDGSFRLLNDLRAVNRLTKVIYHPMPRIDDCLEAIRGAKYFNMFDLYQGYFQIEIPPSERSKTAFVTPDGKYQYKRLPMGLACAPFEFQRLMNTVLNGLNYTECLGYFDDIPVIGKSWEELLTNTSLVLDRLRDWNLKIKTDKCSFGVTELVLLGHLVNGDGIRPDPGKVTALKRLPYPTTVRQLQSQLGCYNYFSRYIRNYSTLAAPLYRLVSKERKFKMLKQDHQALDELKNSLIETTLLVHFDPEMRRKITVDASDIAVGGILLQEDREQEVPKGFESMKDVPIEKVKHWKPLYFFSQKLAKHQTSYSVSEKECLAILIAIKKFKHYLDGEEFLIETDHHALCQLTKLKFKNQRLERWTIILSSFKFKVVYVRGDQHGPDCLSRYQSEWDHRKLLDPEAEYIEDLYFLTEEDFENDEVDQKICELEIYEAKTMESDLLKSFKTVIYYQAEENWNETLIAAQRNDDYINDIILTLINDPKSELNEKFLFLNNLLFHKPMIGHDSNRIVINDEVLKSLFKEEHESPIGGHFGTEKTYLQIARRFWMPNLYNKVKDLCNNCETCYLSKSSNVTYSEPSLKPIPETILDRLEMDAQGPITFKNGPSKVILVLIDTLSRFVYAQLYPNQNSKTVIKFLDEFFSIFGYPSVIQTDRGRNFLSGDVENHLKKFGIKHDVSNAYHPQSQGTVERVNRTIAERLRTSINGCEVINLNSSLESAVIAINSSIHKSHRFSPYFLVFGKSLMKPIDLQLNLSSEVNDTIENCRKIARDRLMKQQIYYQTRLESKTRRNPYKFADLCYLKNCAPSVGTTKKLVNKFDGPYFVLGTKHGSLLLLNPENMERFTGNMELTKPHVGDIPENLIELKNKLIAEKETPDDNSIENLNSSASNSSIYANDKSESLIAKYGSSRADNNLSEINDKSSDDLFNCDNESFEADQPNTQNDNQSESESSTIAEKDYVADLSQRSGQSTQNVQDVSKQKSKKKKRKKYKTANRSIMDNPIISGQDNGPVTRNKKVIPVYFLMEIEFQNLKRFKLCASKPLAILRAQSETQLTLEKHQSTPSIALSLLLSSIVSVNLFSSVQRHSLSVSKLHFNLVNSVEFNSCLKLINQFQNSSSVSKQLTYSVKSKNLIRLNQKSVESFVLNIDSGTLTSILTLTLDSSSFKKLIVIDFKSLLSELVKLFNFNHQDSGLIVEQLTLLWFKFCENLRILILIMPSSVASSASSSSTVASGTIISSPKLARRLARNLQRFQREAREEPEKNFPLVTLDDQDPDDSTWNPDNESKEANSGNNDSNLDANPGNGNENSGKGNLNDCPNNETPGNSNKATDGWGVWPTENAYSANNAEVNDVLNDKPYQREYRDPLPPKTAYGLTDFRRHYTDTSSYPPPGPNQGRAYCLFPAPKPAPESSLPEFAQVEFFKKADKNVDKDIEKSKTDKLWFESFIKEKLQFNVFDADLENLKFGTLRKGFAASHVIHPDLVRLKELVVCTLCEQVALIPKICGRCHKIYCLGCIRWLQAVPADMELSKIDHADEFLCIYQKCLLGIVTQGYPKIATVINPEVRKFFEEATFRCHRKFCEFIMIFSNVGQHLQSCKRGPVDFEFDKTLQLSFFSGPVRAELNKKPKNLYSLLPAHLKKQEPPKTLNQFWEKKALGIAFLSKTFKHDPTAISPLEIRAQANIKNYHWNNMARLKDPTEPIDEGEQFALAIGVPSVAPKPIPEVPEEQRRWPTIRSSTIPYYLLNESENWRRWAKYIAPSSPDSISTTSSIVMYSPDIDDPDSPFIKINPFDRLAPAEAEEVQDYLKENFPSCLNPTNTFKIPVSTKQSTIFHRERKRGFLAEAFGRRPEANVPAMLDEQLKVIETMSEKFEDKKLIFSISMFCVRINENGYMRPRPCWVLIMDGNFEVVYETFVRYREVDHIDSRFHGLRVIDLKYARNLHTVRDQVIKYLVCAKKIIGHGLINHLQNLGYSREEIRLLHPKLRDVNNFYSPFIEHPLNIHAIAFLWFTGYTLPAFPHSPAVEALTTMRLYLLQWTEIEKVARNNGGIHNENVASTCGNRITSALLHEFQEGLAKGFVKWPVEWRQNPRSIKIPEFNDNCVLPSPHIFKKPERMSEPDLQGQKEYYCPQFRAKRIVQMIATGKRSADNSGSSSPKSPKTEKTFRVTFADDASKQEESTSNANQDEELPGWNN